MPLPEPEARKAMFEELMPSQPDDEKLPCDLLVERTEGFSGSDIRLLCKEAAMQPLRRLMTLLEDREEVVVSEDGKLLLAYIFLKDIQKIYNLTNSDWVMSKKKNKNLILHSSVLYDTCKIVGGIITIIIY